MTQADIQQAVESIWALFRETDRRIQETDRQIKEVSEQFKETDRQIKEVSQQFKETDRRLDQQFKETDRQIKEVSQQFKETDRRLDRIAEETRREIAALSAQTRAAERLFTGQWGRLMEALVRPGVVRLFQDWGIPVSRTLERVRARRGGEEMELDLLLVDGDALVIVEVKTTLRANHVRELLDDLKTFPDFFPEYKGYRRFGAAATLAIEQAADRYAYRQGLFVLTLGREGLVTLRNDDVFRPRDFTTGNRIKPA
ncbi:MAG: hypothetical protein LGR52_09290 [Candidatus Thiosymbion ectosymbiont of Robbea hypermnestra]|nr:hypothetical protein [Candidatus Thiosymbion ectosymbiont of Robbea hypermnestra]